MSGFFFVAAGGALGAAGRYAVSLLPYTGSFPVLTLLTNFAGALLIGFIVGVGGSRNATLFWKTGVCGGFTTFSTFSLEAVTLFQNGRYLLGGAYVLLSVALCVAGVLLGQCLARAVAHS